MITTNDKLFAALFGNQDTETIPDDVPLTDEDFKSPNIDNSVLELVEAYNKLKDENLNLKEMNRSLLSNNDEYSKALLAACEQIDNLQESLDEAEEVIEALNEEIDCKNDNITDLRKKYNKLLEAIKKAIA